MVLRVSHYLRHPHSVARTVMRIVQSFSGTYSDPTKRGRSDTRCSMPDWRQVFVSEGLFGVLDQGNISADTADFSNGLVAPMDRGAFILTGINTGYVRVQTRVLDARPHIECDEWEEVVEASVHAPTGDLKVESLDLGPDTEFVQSLSPSGRGWYRIRVHARGREILRDKATMEPVEDYLLIVWPSDPAETTVLRESEYMKRRMQTWNPHLR